MATRFRAKRWIFFALALVSGTIASVGLTMGPLCLLRVLHRVNGELATDAGWPLILVGVAFLAVFAQAVFNIRIRQRPLLQIFREGIEYREIGRSSLDSIRVVPGLIRIAWSICSGQGFRSRVLRVSWQAYQGVRLSGQPMARVLTIAVRPNLASPQFATGPTEANAAIVMLEVDFKERLDRIAEIIARVADSPSARQSLASWDADSDRFEIDEERSVALI